MSFTLSLSLSLKEYNLSFIIHKYFFCHSLSLSECEVYLYYVRVAIVLSIHSFPASSKCYRNCSFLAFSICDNIYNCVILTLVKRGCNVLLFFLYALVLPFVFVFVINIDVVFVISPIEEFKGDCGR